MELLNGNYGGTPTEAHQHSLLYGIQQAVSGGTEVFYKKACELDDEYTTVHHLQDFNDGKGVKIDFEKAEREILSAYNGIQDSFPLCHSVFHIRPYDNG